MAVAVPPWRTVFFGTDAFALATLRTLRKSLAVGDLEVVCPRPRGKVRGRPAPAPVLDFANAERMPVHHFPEQGWAGWAEAVMSRGPWDVGVVVSFGHIVPPFVVATFGTVCLNLHPSLLPRHRGAAPMTHTILNGDEETGVSVIQLEPELDSGDILHSTRFPVPPRMTYVGLHEALAITGAQAVELVLNNTAAMLATRQPQSADGVTHASKVNKDMTKVALAETTVLELDRLHRALGHAFPVSVALDRKRVQLLHIQPAVVMPRLDLSWGAFVLSPDRAWLQIRCHDGWVECKALRWHEAGAKAMTPAEFVNHSYVRALPPGPQARFV